MDSESVSVSVRDFLDKKQYSDSGIEAYEWIFGHGFISPGGGKKNDEFLCELNIRVGDYMLDVGSGIGGNAFQASKKYGCKVLGIDLSSNMTAIAIERAQNEKDKRVEFSIADAMGFDLPENSFDFIYSRDCIIHIADKIGLFKRFYQWLKPNGVLFFTDYNVGDKEHTPEFQAYLNDRQYTLKTIPYYVDALHQAGFREVDGCDMTEKFKDILITEWKNVENDKDTFCQKFSKAKYDQLVDGWQNKLANIASGDHKWGGFKAVKK